MEKLLFLDRQFFCEVYLYLKDTLSPDLVVRSIHFMFFFFKTIYQVLKTYYKVNKIDQIALLQQRHSKRLVLG